MKDTLIVNLYGGPGSGKSTTCAGLYARLKCRGILCEQVLEYAKELVWENNTTKLADQIYIFGKQNRRMNVVRGKVDVIITDSPLLLSIIYGANNYPEFKALVVSEFRKMRTVDVFLDRSGLDYQTEGREQTEDGAHEKDREILRMFDELGIISDMVSGPLDRRLDVIEELVLEKISGGK